MEPCDKEPGACLFLITRFHFFERMKYFLWTFLGQELGSAMTFALSGVLTDNFGWQWDFYLFGIIGILFSILWIILVSSSPMKHSKISKVSMYHVNSRNPVFIYFLRKKETSSMKAWEKVKLTRNYPQHPTKRLPRVSPFGHKPWPSFVLHGVFTHLWLKYQHTWTISSIYHWLQ